MNSSLVGVRFGRTFRIALLVASVGIALALVVPAWSRFRAASNALAEKRSHLALLRSAQPTRSNTRIPAEPEGEREYQQFLRDLTGAAAAAHCGIIGWETMPNPTQTGEVRQRTLRVHLRAYYPEVREFLAQISNARRLYKVLDLSLAPAEQEIDRPKLNASLSIGRYVIAAPAPQAGEDVSK